MTWSTIAPGLRTLTHEGRAVAVVRRVGLKRWRASARGQQLVFWRLRGAVAWCEKVVAPASPSGYTGVERPGSSRFPATLSSQPVEEVGHA